MSIVYHGIESANIFITMRGPAKVLDLEVAKLAAAVLTSLLLHFVYPYAMSARTLAPLSLRHNYNKSRYAHVPFPHNRLVHRV